MKNFSISVCYFHLNQTLAESIDEFSPDADLIWENLINLNKTFPFSELKNLKSHLACYELDQKSNTYRYKTEALNLVNQWLTTDQKLISLTPIEYNDLELTGTLQPFLFHDIYAFDLTIDFVQDVTLQKIKDFNPTDLFLESTENTLGETIWLYGEVGENDDQCQILANKLVEKFLENTKFTFRLVDHGKLLKAPFLEYQVSNSNKKQIYKEYRILVWLNNTAKPLETTSAYNYLLGSLRLYHKIEYVYQQGQESYRQAREFYSQLEAEIKKFKQDQSLEELQKRLESLPEISMDYQLQLRNLQAHYTTIKTNQTNYQNYLKHFWQPGDIVLWQEFGEITCKRYLDQLETHLEYIKPGKDLIGEFINTIRGIVEIEQAESDRSLERNIQILGAGLGAGGIVASSISGHMDNFPPLYILGVNQPLNPGLASIGYSALAALTLGAIVGLVNGAIPALFKARRKRRSLPDKNITNKQQS